MCVCVWSLSWLMEDYPSRADHCALNTPLSIRRTSRVHICSPHRSCQLITWSDVIGPAHAGRHDSRREVTLFLVWSDLTPSGSCFQSCCRLKDQKLLSGLLNAFLIKLSDDVGEFRRNCQMIVMFLLRLSHLPQREMT